DVFAPTARIIHIDLDAYEIAKNYRVDIGVVADAKESMRQLAVALERMMSPGERKGAERRIAELASRKHDADLAAKAKDALCQGSSPLPMGVFARELAKHLPAGTMVFDEAL